MKIQKDEKGFIDPSIAALIAGGEERQAMASMPRGERKKKLKAKAQQDARNGRRAVYDMDPDVIKAIAAIAAYKKCSASNVAEIFLRFAMQAKVDLDQFRVPVQHPRFECKLVWPKSE